LEISPNWLESTDKRIRVGSEMMFAYWTWKPRRAFGSRPLNSPLTDTGPRLRDCSKMTVPVTFELPDRTADA
jgi:hypothetical protein